ncbi:3'-5' exonuclease [Candidatus Woesearchaeota archaeon]|nr:3'-5' exonuclease [Candidatus Woesearchaeota archaeon]
MLVIDCETTGTYYKRHSIASIGAVDFDHPDRQFYRECQIYEGAQIDHQALDVNGFTRDSLTDPRKPSLEDAVREFCTWAGVDVTAGGNPDFDWKFLRESAKKYNIPWQLARVAIDIISLCYGHQLKRRVPKEDMVAKRATVDETLHYAGLPTEPRPHHALTGAKMEAEALSRLVSGKGLFEEYKQLLVPEYLRTLP